jgi:hypothetical protein
MDPINEVPETRESDGTSMDLERTVAAPGTVSLSDQAVPETDNDEIRATQLNGTKGKAKQTSDPEDLDDFETERIGLDIGLPFLAGDLEPSSTQDTLETEADEVNLVPSQSSQTAHTQANSATPALLENSEAVDDEDEEAGTTPILILRDPVRVRRHDYMARDVAAFLLNYPNRVDNPESTANVLFYNNEIRFRPYGILIDDFHTRAFRRFKLLEQHHGYPFFAIPLISQVYPMALSD